VTGIVGPWRSPAAGSLLLGLLLTLAATWQMQRSNQAQRDEALAAATEDVANQLTQRIALYEYGLRGARGAIIAMGEHVSRDAFRRYHQTRDLHREFPGAHGFGFIRRVAPGDVPAFEAAAAADGFAGFHLRQLAEHEGPHDVIQYIEPEADNRVAVGLDVASEPQRHQAAERAARTGQATMTAPLTLVQASSKARQGFLLLLPIYRPGLPQGTVAEREAALIGWSYAPLVMEEVLAQFDYKRTQVALLLADVDTDAPQAPQPFYAAPANPVAAMGALPRSAAVQRQIMGRTWAVQLQALPAFEASLKLLSPSLVFLAGLFGSLLLSWAVSQRAQGLRRARQARAAQDRLATIVENSSDAIIVESLDGTVTAWNRAAEQIFGWSASEAMGQPLSQLIGTPESAQETQMVLQRAASGEVLHPFDAVRRRKNGAVLDVSIAASAITDANGQVVGVGKSLRDITARRALERQLQQFNQRLESEVSERTVQLENARRDLRTILDALPSMVGYWDHHQVNRFANRAYTDWFGKSPDSLVGCTLLELLGPELYERNRAYIEGALAGEPQVFERAIRAPSGMVRQSLAHYLPDRQSDGVRGFYVLVHDVSELHRSRQLLAQREALLNRTGAIARIGGWYIDLDTQQLTWTRQTRQIHEVDDDYEPTREAALAFFPQPGRARIETSLADALASGGGWDLELPLITARGREIWVRAIGEAELAGEGAEQRNVRLVGTIQDITERRQTEQAARRAEAAESANAAKSVFLANVSHEMRTPLNAVIGFTHLLADTRLNTDQRHLLARIRSAGRQLLGVINDVLDLSKIEAGQMTLESTRFELPALVQEVAELLQPAAQQKQLAFRCTCGAALPQHCLGDEVRLRQILTNLVANAIKFTEHGEVRLVADCQPPEPGEPVQWVRFEVHDTGLGIPPDVQARLFQPFMQADSSTTRRFGGTGLGLSIVRHLVALMNGELALESRAGEGSCFRVSLPLQLATPPDAHPSHLGGPLPGPRRLAGLSILVVDDADINLELVRRLLEAEGARVATASHGPAVLARLADPQTLCDAVLMDVQMPGMDGLEVTRRLRELPHTRTLPVIALTAGAMVSERRSALDAGMNAFVSKPFSPQTLIDTVRQAVEQARGEPLPALHATHPNASAGSTAWPELPGIRTEQAREMLGDDLPGFRHLLGSLLRDVGRMAALGAPPYTAAQRQAWLTQAHKLQGSAGILGAETLQVGMRQLEALLHAPADDQAASHEALTQQLDALAAEARRLQQWLEALPAEPALPDPASAKPLAPEQRSRLVQLLAQQDLGALSLYREIRPSLLAGWPAPAAEALEQAMATLDFATALRLLASEPITDVG